MIEFVDCQTYCEITFSTAASTKINTKVYYGIGWGNNFEQVQQKLTTADEAAKAANSSMWYKLYKKPIPKIPVTIL